MPHLFIVIVFRLYFFVISSYSLILFALVFKCFNPVSHCDCALKSAVYIRFIIVLIISPKEGKDTCGVVQHFGFATHLHSNDGVDEEEHGDEQTHVRQRLSRAGKKQQTLR